EDGFSPDLKKYSVNLGRTDKEMDEMRSRTGDELFPVLTGEEQKSFDMQKTIDGLDRVFGSVS
ncbi:MAG: hypothetical protein PHP46_06405, partial [Candidatus Omnitrophica bacterium]|nr:hypothetical protein [Candidatus Omnitrophota bacterium]